MKIVLSLDSWPALRDLATDDRSELGAAAALAELAGVDSLRLSINEDLAPVREVDVDTLRRSARSLELRMPVFGPFIGTSHAGFAEPVEDPAGSASRSGGSRWGTS